MSVWWLVVGRLVGWSAFGWLLVCWMVGWGWLVCQSVGWFALGRLLVSWLVGWGSWLVGWSKVVGLMVALCLVVVDLPVVVWTNPFYLRYSPH